jgi:hypothetical protein
VSQTSGTPAQPATIAHPSRDMEMARSLGELIAATEKARAREIKASDGYYSAGDAIYVKIKNTGKWPGKIDKIMKARRLRKLSYQAGAQLETAAQALSALIYEAQTILSESKASGSGFDATK